MLENTPNQPTKFRAKNWVEINDKSRGKYNTKNQIRFRTSVLRTGLCDYSDAYILVKGTITVANTAAADAAANNTNKKIIFKKCVPFTSCISRIMYNLIEYSDTFPKRLEFYFNIVEMNQLQILIIILLNLMILLILILLNCLILK